MSTKGVKVTIFTEKLEELDDAAKRALELTAERVHGEIEQAQVIPFKEGELQKDTKPDPADLANGHVDVASNKPYARRLYYHPEYHFSKEENPNAGGLWFEPWADGGDRSEGVKTAFAAFFKREAGL